MNSREREIGELPSHTDEDKSIQNEIFSALEKDTCMLNESLLEKESSLSNVPENTAEYKSGPKQQGLCETCLCQIAQYKCPKCKIRSCSLLCIGSHKEKFNCDGRPQPEEYIAVSNFTNRAIRRDFSMLVAAQRFAENSRRSVQPEKRFNHKDLPPSLQSLSTNARKNGVVLQIMSNGIRKRLDNTSRYIAHDDSIIWRIDFILHFSMIEFHDASTRTTKISTDWASSCFLLKDIFATAWERNPNLQKHKTKRGYNTASKWISPDSTDTGQEKVENPSDVSACSDRKESLYGDVRSHFHEIIDTAMFSGAVSGTSNSETDENRKIINQFLAEASGRYFLLYKAERLGPVDAYFLLDPDETLAWNLRSVFYVVEYPIIHVILESDLHKYQIITEEQKTSIRASFRKQKSVKSDRQDDENQKDSRMKTAVPCANYTIKGYCKLKNCPRTHYEPHELPVCRAFMKGFQCPKTAMGERCLYSHDPSRAPAAQYYSVVKGRR